MKRPLAQQCSPFSGFLGAGLSHVAFAGFLIAICGTADYRADPKLETGRPAIRNFLPSEYQAHDQNTGAVQDSHGLVYFGNRNLVLQYDGETWRQIPVPNADLIHGIAIDRNDRIYVGGFNELGYIDNRSRTEKIFESLTDQLPSEDRDFREVWDIHPTPQGVYFAASQRLFRWFNGQFKVWRLPASARLS